jgi:phosphatidylglycerol:prolipoprotein diacylglycerol transferase
MKPILIRFADGSYIHSGHFMLFVGGLLAIILIAIETKRTRERPEKIWGLTVLLLISAVYGAHIFYWIDFRKEYGYGLKHLFIFWKGGMALYGGGILAFVTYVLYTRWQRLDFWSTGDLLTPPAALFVVCARIGCTLSGCCHGSECSPGFPFALPANPPTGPIARDTPVYPTQPAFAACALIVLLILWIRRKRKRFNGEIALLGVLLYSIPAFVIEFYRGDLRILYQVIGTQITQNQVIGVNLFLAASILYFYLWRESRRVKQPVSDSSRCSDEGTGEAASVARTRGV